MLLKEIAQVTGTTLKGNGTIEIQAPGDIEIHSHLNPENPVKPATIYFVETARILRDRPELKKADAVLTTQELASEFDNAILAPEKEIRLAFIALLDAFAPKLQRSNLRSAAWIAEDAYVAEDAVIMPGAVVLSGARIGSGTILYPNVTIEENAVVGSKCILYSNSVVGHHCIVGDGCILHSGSVIGSDGFGFRDIDGVRYKIPQIGNVILEEDVELGAGTTIDRATIDSTRIGAHTKIDDQVHIGHNCQIGRNVYIAGNAGIAGSVVVEDGAVIAGQAGIADHVTIGKGTVVLGMTGVPESLDPGKVYFGIPARPVREMHKINASLSELPELIKRVKKIEHEQNSGI